MRNSALTISETFDMFPEKCLRVDKNSNYYYVEAGEETFITRKEIKSINPTGRDSATVIYGYNSVIDDKLVAVSKKTLAIMNIEEKPMGARIIKLSDVLNINSSEIYYLNLDDIKTLINFNKDDPKKDKSKIK